MLSAKSYPAKILLLGEYTILSGSKALALPYDEFSGKWTFEPRENESAKTLKSFLSHHTGQSLDMEALKRDLDLGLWFDSNIPHGHGLGSSGALIAAIYDSYSKDRRSLLEEKEYLARLEDYFHGSSSGIDPLVSYLQKPLLLHSSENIEILENSPSLKGFFLVDTNKLRHTASLVTTYKEKLKDPQFKQGCAEILSCDVNLAIQSLLKDDSAHLFHHLWHISKFQWDFFPEMIPTQMRGLWTRGIETGDYILKLCGAGGGGFLLGYSEKLDREELQDLFGDHLIRELK